MKKQFIIYIFALLLLLPWTVSCSRDLMEKEAPDSTVELPEGIPITLTIPFGNTDMYEVEVGTKTTSTAANESHVHDLYVMIFDTSRCIPDGTPGGSPRKIYGRYFAYEHLKETIYALDRDPNESWYVENKTMDHADNAVAETIGAVKVSTITCAAAKVVVLANVENAVMNLDGIDALDRLNAVLHYNEMRGINVCLEQDVVNRKDLFLMTGEMSINTKEMKWGTATYDGDTPVSANYAVGNKITLNRVDAKVKFRVKVNTDNISAVTPVYWQVCNTPDRCYLYSDYAGGAAPEGISPFASQQYYFEGKEVEAGETYYTFSFYMLENRETPNGTATEYYQRELREKIDSGEPGYKGPTGEGNEAFSNHFVDNGDWLFAPTFGTYVCFDLVLTLTTAGIEDIGSEDPEGMKITQALTSDAIFTVHLGDFSSSTSGDSSQLNNYNTLRGNSYTYTVTINNTRSIFAEVKRDDEVQSGQEGFLLLTDSEIINADCHYEYHQIEFPYRPDMSQKKFSWYVKTPFGEGGPVITESNGVFSYNAAGLDYKWVLFGVNSTVPEGYNPSGDPNPDSAPWYDAATDTNVCPYTKKRHAYPGDNHYDPNWKPGQRVSEEVPVKYGPSDPLDPKYRMVPDLMDVTQLIQYIFYQTDLERRTGVSDFIADNVDLEEDMKPVIRVTAFIDEYYYLSDPTQQDAPLDPDLWRKFVNANPRELHILSDAQQSRDRKSDVILSSHSVIQQSIQTIYNIYAADLHSLWGAEHLDEMKEKSELGWMYWPKYPDPDVTERSGSFDTMTGKENGRLNSAYIWRLYSKQDNTGEDYTAPGYPDNDKKKWDTFLDYDVNNNTPELRQAYQGMAFSCLTRNRDNNGNGKIDRDEVRWYLAAPNQLIGMWVGNESLSLDARIYRPAKNQWRAHILSSADKRVAWAEEGSGATKYDLEDDAQCWGSFENAAKGESVRCLRNIGTYTDTETGRLTEITNAPYKVRPERYFTITPEPGENLTQKDEPNIRYVFHFDRINPKSLRELSETDLPYADQFSLNNCVYLQMQTQARVDEKILNPENPADDPYPGFPYPFDLTMKEINPKVDSLGYNPFCPPGYRFPNESEMLLMSVYLPESFFTYGATNSDKLPSTWITSRTYFDRGCYGQNTEGFEFDNEGYNKAKTREQGKVGFGYNTNSNAKKNSCANVGVSTSHSRCVRDINRTGDIEGGILIKDELYPGDRVPLTFSFNSSGSTFISASLKFCYTDGSGVYHERDIPIQTSPSGLQYLSTQDFTIPTLASLGMSENQPAKFKMTLRNAYSSKTFEQPFVLGNPLQGSLTLSPDTELYPSDTKTMNFNFTSKANTCKLSSVTMKLKYNDQDDTPVNYSLTIPDLAPGSQSYTRQNEGIDIPSLGTLNLVAANIDEPRDATLEVRMTDEGGSTKTFEYPVKLANPLTFSLDSEEYVYPNDNTPVSLDFRTRSCGKLDEVNLELEYEDHSGTTQTITLIPTTNPDSKTYVTTENIELDDLATLGLVNGDLVTVPGKSVPCKAMTLRAYLHESLGYEKTLELPVYLRSHLEDVILEFPSTYNNDHGLPVHVAASLVAGKTATISGASLKYKKNNDVSWNTTNWTDVFDETYYTDDFDAAAFANKSFIGANYNYCLSVSCDDGTSVTLVRSMQVLRFNYDPNGNTWSDKVEGLYYGRGDYVEAQIVASHNTDVNTSYKDGLICLGVNIGTFNGNNFQFYLGDKVTDPPTLRASSHYNGNSGRILYRAQKQLASNNVNMRFDSSGLAINTQEFTDFWKGKIETGGDVRYASLVGLLTSGENKTLYIGQTEGSAHSYSHYPFIRVVRFNDVSAPTP